MDEKKNTPLIKRLFAIVLLLLFILLLMNIIFFQVLMEFALAAYALVILLYLFVIRKPGKEYKNGDEE